MVKLQAILFKEEEINGIYRCHFIVYLRGVEITRFALEFKKKPSKKTLASKVDQVLAEIGKAVPPPPEAAVFEKEV